MMARRLAIAIFLIFGGGLLAGHEWGAAPLRLQLAEARSAHDQVQRLAADLAVQRLQAAQARGDALSLRLAEREQSISTLTQEKRHALANTTTGRACLGPAALRVLDGAPGLRVSRVADLPEAASGAAAAGGAVATYSDDQQPTGRWASDSDIGTWALATGAQYEQCRARLDALIGWHRPTDLKLKKDDPHDD